MKKASIVQIGTEMFIKIKIEFNTLQILEIKNIPGKKWDAKNKCWILPLSWENCLKLIHLKYQLSQELKTWARKAYKLTKIPVGEYPAVDVPGLKENLFHYQAVGVGFLNHFDGRGLIADEMGLGKSAQALAYVQLHPEKKPIIIICPASLKQNWVNEAFKWLPNPSVQIITGTKQNTQISNEIVVINYDIVPHWIKVLKAIQPRIIIIDEGHYIKNNESKRTKAVKFLCKGIPHVIILTGTPIENRPVEIYNAIQLINPSLFPNSWFFKQRYCGAKHNGFGWTFNGSTNVQELHDKLVKNGMIRRKKKDVLKDLPDKIYSFIPLEIDNQKTYEKAEKDFVQYVKDEVEIKTRKFLSDISDNKIGGTVVISEEKLKILQNEKASKATALAQIEALKQLAVQGKLNSVIEWITDFLNSDEKLIVFATHRFIIDRLMEMFGKIAVKIDGSTAVKNRQKIVENFQNNKKIKLFIGNIKAAGVGITLTAASNVAFIEYPWIPGELVQASDRAHRIGQKYTVNIHYLMAMNTIEENIAKMLDEKQKTLDMVLDGKETDSDNLLTQLIQKYVEKTMDHKIKKNIRCG